MKNTKPTLYFFGTVQELYKEIEGDWEFEHHVYKLKYHGATRITWYPTTGAFNIQADFFVKKAIYDTIQSEVLSKAKYYGRTKLDLEHYKPNKNLPTESMRVDLKSLLAPSETPWA